MSHCEARSPISLCPICRGTGLRGDAVCRACKGEGNIIAQDVSHSAREAILRARALRDSAQRTKEHSRALQHKILTSLERPASSSYKAAAPVSLSLPEFLHNAVKVSCADFGNIQWFEPGTRSLRIVAHQGFDSAFLNYFAQVTAEPGTACGKAMQSGSRVVVRDVKSDPIFCNEESGDVLLQSNVRSVQSTPLVTRAGSFVGVLSTHYRRAGGPSHHALERLDKIIAEYTELLSMVGS